MKDDTEITITDQLLVTGKKPYSLAKFLSTSMVFRKTVGDAQLEDEVSFVKNFGWAPQRFNSRARPYARECRRWKTIFDAVSAEATGQNRDRATMYLVELGGEHSSRLVLAGLLADLSAEHYTWVVEADTAHPPLVTTRRLLSSSTVTNSCEGGALLARASPHRHRISCCRCRG